MARVTDAEVKEIIDTARSVRPFITAANLIVTDRLSSTDLSAAHLKEIERWLAAHLLAVSDKRSVEEQVGSSRVRYADKFGLGLDFTEFGQQVKVLDTTGTLAKLGLKRASFDVITESDDATFGEDSDG